MWPSVLIDSNVMMDFLLPFREGHENARKLFELLAQKQTSCLVPSHGYFEYLTTAIIHFKREPDVVTQNPIQALGLPNIQLQVVSLTLDYVNELLDGLKGGPYPDLKSQDMIFFCIARNRGAMLLTNDRKLRNTARKGGIAAFEADEAIAALSQNMQS
jgi:predicted nucleic acid-binding protein